MTSAEPFFRPIRQRALSFRGKEMATADLPDGHGYISVRSMCEAFGLDARAQRRRLMRQQGFFAAYTATVLMDTPGGAQKTLCLRDSVIPMFLTGVELERVQEPEARAFLQAFLDEVHIVLAEHFGISERGEIQFLRESVARMVAEQEDFAEQAGRSLKKVEAELAEMRRAHEEKVQQIRGAFGELRQQVTRIESVAGPKQRLTPEQMGQLRQSVATLGALLQERGVAKPYPGIYMDITRLTGVSRTEDIRQEDFAAVLEFLESQVQAFTRPSGQRAADD